MPALLQDPKPFGGTTVDRSTPRLLRELTDLSQHSAARGHFQQTIDVEDDVAARHSHLVERAARNTTKMLEGLFAKFGYTDVTVVYDGPGSVSGRSRAA